uniref:uncharacterized protein LOC105350917 n=1 Tax=Fragaria vesca subsp. vesca TaxID=101020 RepID=UPI0005C887E9|nr:PREDICTED: uncharacterized protein LOC105350917 [Fragaria vesca subsp. vesca]
MPEEEEVFNLAEDLIVKILCRLPVKSLIRFSCVRKGGVLLSFLTLSLPNLTSNIVLVSTISLVYGDTDLSERYLTLTGTSQLQCLEDLSGDTFRVRNCTFPSEQHSTIVMDSCNGFVILGTTDDYKLVLVIADDDSGAAKIVYEDMDVNIFIFLEHCFKYDVDGSLVDELCIYAFDLASEELRRMPVPAGFNQDDQENYHVVQMQTVVHLGGCLCLLSQSRKEFEGSDDIGLWMMRDYGVSDSWMEVFEFSEDDLSDGIASPCPRSD